MKVFLDTHAVLFLHAGLVEEFGADSKHLLSVGTLTFSPAVRLEMKSLHECGKLVVDPDLVLGRVASELGLCIAGDSLASVADRAMGLTWTRDPFDRLIVANADLHGAALVTRDRRILDHYKRAVW